MQPFSMPLSVPVPVLDATAFKEQAQATENMMSLEMLNLQPEMGPSKEGNQRKLNKSLAERTSAKTEGAGENTALMQDIYNAEAKMMTTQELEPFKCDLKTGTKFKTVVAKGTKTVENLLKRRKGIRRNRVNRWKCSRDSIN